MYRQGDILLRPISTPRDAWKTPTLKVFAPRGTRAWSTRIGRTQKDGIIIAAGEATDHHHRVRDSRQAPARLIRNGNRELLLVGKKGATVTHEEHEAIQLPPGTYEVVRQREYAPNPVAERAWSYVAD